MRPVVRTLVSFFFFNDTATTEIYTLSLHDALPISVTSSPFSTTAPRRMGIRPPMARMSVVLRSEEHTSELQSQSNLVCRLLLEKKKNNLTPPTPSSTRHTHTPTTTHTPPHHTTTTP